MSGIYINGMEMPISCYHCWIPCEVPFEDRNHLSRAKNCPAVPVRDHGRLIDADVLFNFIFYIYKTAQGSARKAYSDVLDIIIAAGEVIPAEEEEQ